MESVLIRCMKCGTINRIKTENIHKLNHCGNCKTDLTIQSKPVEVDNFTFQKEVMAWPGFVLVEFWSASCVFCRMLENVLSQVASEQAGLIKIAKINTSSSPNLAQQFGVQGVPHMLIFQGGRKISEISGALPKMDLVKWISMSTGIH